MPPPTVPAPPSPPKLLDRVRWHLRVKHYSLRTEELYIQWIRRFILFHQKRHPQEMGEEEIAAFLSHLAIERHVAASTQNQAFSALLFLYQQVLDRKLDYLAGVERVKRPPKVPVVLTKKEAQAVIARLQGEYRLMAELLYGSGLRLLECLRLRIKDIDFGYEQIMVRDRKGLRERRTLLPGRLKQPLRDNLLRVREIHRSDLAHGAGDVYLPLHSGENIRAPAATGAGNGFSQLRSFRSTRALAKRAAITCTKRICRMQSGRLFTPLACQRPPVATLFDTALPLISWKRVMISAQSKNCLDTRTSRQQ
jgi:integrase